MAGDIEIEVDFKNSIAGAGMSQAGMFDSGSGSGGEQKGAGVFAKGLKMAGVVGFLSQLKPIVDIMGVLVGMLSAGLGYLISVFVRYIEPFFKDPMRELMRLGIFIVNGFISGIEVMTNAIVSAVTFGAVGTGDNKIEFGRFREDIILEAYDKMQEQVKLQEQGSTTFMNTYGSFMQTVADSFLTDEEYKIVRDAAEKNQVSMLETLDSVDNVFNIVDEKVAIVKSSIDKGFNAIESAMNYITKKFNKLSSSGSSGADFDKFTFGGLTTSEYRNKYGG